VGAVALKVDEAGADVKAGSIDNVDHAIDGGARDDPLDGAVAQNDGACLDTGWGDELTTDYGDPRHTPEINDVGPAPPPYKTAARGPDDPSDRLSILPSVILDRFRLDGTAAIVTGAGRGIGAADGGIEAANLGLNLPDL